MPDDRFLHRACGHSTKVNMLTSDEFRVWTQYLLSADDFGLMLFSSRTLRADNDFLDTKGPKIVQRWLNRVNAVGLLITFEHQERLYCCQLDWQDWQGVEYPRPTVHPKPPQEVLDQCDLATKLLFSVHPGGRRAPSLKSKKEDSELSPNVPQSVDHLAHAHAQMAKAKAKANGSELERGAGENRTSPRTSSGVMAGSLQRDHLRHAFCGRVCVPDFLHGQFLGQLSGSRDEAEPRMREFYERTLASIPASQDIGDEQLAFWRKHFAAAFTSAAPAPRQARPASHTPAPVDKYAGIGVRDDVE